MLGSMFARILDRSLAAGAVILVVLAARLLLRRAPGIYSYVLWAVVLLRLLSPVTLTSPAAVLPAPDAEGTYSLAEEDISPAGAAEAAYRAVGDALNGGLDIQHIRTTQRDTEGNVVYADASWWEVWILFGGYVWLAGLAVMLLRGAVGWRRLLPRLREAVPVETGVYEADGIAGPFVAGLLKPRIYLPVGLEGDARKYILAHERQHIRRGDHAWKLLFWLALCIHWFNPLVWLAFRLFSVDMEMSCDERVIRKLSPGGRGDYAQLLLRFAQGRRSAGMPLAFGEGDVKKRILHMAAWKEPKNRTRLLAAGLCVLVLLGCAFDQPEEAEPDTGTYRMETGAERLAVPTLCLDLTNMRFDFSYDPLSSYWPVGTVEFGDGTLICSTYDGWCRYTFEVVDEDTLRYVGRSLPTVENKLAVPYGALLHWEGELEYEIPKPGDTAAETHCTDPGCTDPAHSHDWVCAEPGCTDPAHGHTVDSGHATVNGSDCVNPHDHHDDHHRPYTR